MSDDFAIDCDAAMKAGQSLSTMGRTLKNGRTYGSATGAEDYDVYGAVDGFTDKWSNALTRLQKSIGDMGDTVVEIAKAYKEHDQQRAKIFKTDSSASCPAPAPGHGPTQTPC